jgi:predicted ATP-dependent Lon-type protease
MSQPATTAIVAASPDNSLDALFNQRFAGKVVRKDLTKSIRKAPTYQSTFWSTYSGCTAPLTTRRL